MNIEIAGKLFSIAQCNILPFTLRRLVSVKTLRSVISDRLHFAQAGLCESTAQGDISELTAQRNVCVVSIFAARNFPLQ